MVKHKQKYMIQNLIIFTVYSFVISYFLVVAVKNQSIIDGTIAISMAFFVGWYIQYAIMYLCVSEKLNNFINDINKIDKNGGDKK